MHHFTYYDVMFYIVCALTNFTKHYMQGSYTTHVVVVACCSRACYFNTDERTDGQHYDLLLFSSLFDFSHINLNLKLDEKMSTIPIIDLECSDSTLHLAWDNAFRRFGCCILVGHGIEAEDFDRLREEATSFFSQPKETKMLFNYGPYGNEHGGYTPQAGEVVAASQGASVDGKTFDAVESFVLNRQTIQQHLDILPHSGAYFKMCEDLMHRLHVLSTRALGIPLEDGEEDYFRKFYDSSDPRSAACGASLNALRLAYYPPQEREGCGGGGGSDDEMGDSIEAASVGAPEVGKVANRYGEHTDYLGFTVLRPDESDWSPELEGAGGLEVLDSRGDGSWISVTLPAESKATALIVNAGDLMQRWTNNRWISPVHRVTGPRAGSAAAAQGRSALVYFSGPMADAIVEVCSVCSASCLERERRVGDHVGIAETAVYEPVAALDYLMAKINPTALHSSEGKTT